MLPATITPRTWLMLRATQRPKSITSGMNTKDDKNNILSMAYNIIIKSKMMIPKRNTKAYF